MRTIGGSLTRYAVVGVLTNALGYLAYLLITALGVGPKTAMTALYLIAVLISYVGNRQWSFADRGSVPASFARYLAVHVGGYLLNFTLLLVFVDQLGLPHQLVQAAAIGIVALFLFTAFRLFVFNSPRSGEAS